MDSISVIYHFFPHYRSAIIEKIIERWPNTKFIASRQIGSGTGIINSYIPSSGFEEIQVRQIGAGKYYLKGLIPVIIKSKSQHVIFLGDINCLSVWVFSLYLRAIGIKVYFWAHGWIDENENLRTHILRKLFFAIPHRILVYGRRARRIATDKGFDPSKIHVIYNSLNYNSQKSLRLSLDKSECRKYIDHIFEWNSESAKYLLCSSRLTSVKQFDLVIRAVSQINSDQKIGIIFVGDGPERTGLETLAEKLNVESRFLGSCYVESDLARYFIGCDAVVSPGNLGLTAMHAMAYGVSVITHNNRNKQMPESEAVIPGLTGELFEEGNVASLAEAIVRAVFRSEEQSAKSHIACISMIETFFNANYQLKKISEAISGTSEEEPIKDIIEEFELDFAK